MTSSIFGKSRWERAVEAARAVVGSGTPEQAYQSMMGEPRFRDFVQRNRGKSPQQVIAEQMAGGVHANSR